MDLHPDDNPRVAALRGKLQAKHGGAYLEVGRVEQTLSGSPDPLLGEDGFRASPDWTELAVADAIACVAALLARPRTGPPSADVAAVSLAEAEALAAQFGALVSEEGTFYSFDSGVLFVDGDRMGRFWVEDED